jgi:hypothetical protein
MSDEQLRRALLEHAVPDPGTAHAYRRKVEAMIQERERALRQEHWMIVIVGTILVLVSVALMVGGGLWFEGQIKGVWLGVNACFCFLFAVMLMLRHTMDQHRVQMLKELKGIEMRVIEIQQRLEKCDAAR